MDTVELLSKFSDPETIKSLTMAQRMTACLVTTVLGMGITFLSLVILQFVIGLMEKLGVEKPAPDISAAPTPPSPQPVTNKQDLTSDEELVAAITTALAFQLKTSVSNIVIRNIEKIEESTSAWHRAGVAEQLNNSL